jgi:hypothetical protein
MKFRDQVVAARRYHGLDKIEFLVTSLAHFAEINIQTSSSLYPYRYVGVK